MTRIIPNYISVSDKTSMGALSAYRDTYISFEQLAPYSQTKVFLTNNQAKRVIEDLQEVVEFNEEYENTKRIS